MTEETKTRRVPATRVVTTRGGYPKDAGVSYAWEVREPGVWGRGSLVEGFYEPVEIEILDADAWFQPLEYGTLLWAPNQDADNPLTCAEALVLGVARVVEPKNEGGE